MDANTCVVVCFPGDWRSKKCRTSKDLKFDAKSMRSNIFPSPYLGNDAARGVQSRADGLESGLLKVLLFLAAKASPLIEQAILNITTILWSDINYTTP